MQQRTAPWPVVSLLARRGTYLEAAMLQNLDLLDLFLLAGSLVYFGLLLMRRI